ncbi:hypothetical protein B0H14DRAFT_2904348 [Mycena olivaceomarginata]|nr:hypothetical protein B0H14DRAFT_2904348 [Mycena olivaceomarginata]
MFRDASQRILLRSLTLKTNVKETHILLEESPHFASYVTRLVVRQGATTIKSQHKSVEQVLGKLTNVRYCIIFASQQNPTFTSTLLDFLARQPLRELTVISRDAVPQAIILHLITTAPIITFALMPLRKDQDPIMFSVEIPGPRPPRAEDLMVLEMENYMGDLYDFLAQPQLKSYTSMLRRLFISFFLFRDINTGVKLLLATAPQLEHLHLQVEFSLVLPQIMTPWFSDLISSTLSTSPLLADIVVSFMPITSGQRAALGPIFVDVLSPTLDVALAAHPRRPAIRWRHDFKGCDERSSAEILAQFTAGVQTAMPKAHEERRLVVEKYQHDRGRMRRLLGPRSI